VKHLVKAIAVALLPLLPLACAVAPVQEMSDARQALDAARELGAEEVAGAEYNEARSLLESAERALQRGRYRSARELALSAKASATAARLKAHDRLP
jgi:hypothetical protein